MELADSRLHRWSEYFDHVIWTADAGWLASQMRELSERLTLSGVRLPAVVAELSDECLFLAFQKGFYRREVAQELFVDRSTPFLQRLYFAWKVPAEEAEELIQHLCVSWYIRPPEAKLVMSHSFRAYLAKAAKNALIDSGRRNRRVSSLESLPELPIDWPTAEQEAEAQELWQNFEEALTHLSSLDADILRQSAQGASAEEIMARTGLSLSAVYLRLFRARKRVAGLLGLPARVRARNSTTEEAEEEANPP